MGIGREIQTAGGGRDGGAGWGPGSTQIGGAGVAHLRGSRDQRNRVPGTLCGKDWEYPGHCLGAV